MLLFGGHGRDVRLAYGRDVLPRARPQYPPWRAKTPLEACGVLTALLQCRCDGGNVEIVKILLASEADPNQPDMFNKVGKLCKCFP